MNSPLLCKGDQSTIKALISQTEARHLAPEESKPYFCKFCGNLVTFRAYEISVQSSHEHEFMNPDDVTYRIGCFSTAEGCMPIGMPTDDFTWFAGYQWQVVLCLSCMNHLGWRYVSEISNGFYGLILNRLIMLPSEIMR